MVPGKKCDILMHSRPRGHKFGRAFTMIEILIVVAILGILAAVVLPRFSDASVMARENTLKDELRYLRTQLVVFKAQHRDAPPGYPLGNLLASPTAVNFLQQMTSGTDDRCNVGPSSATHPFGPYLNKMPVNPLNGLDTVLIVDDVDPLPPADNTTGWILKPRTLEIIPNTSGVDGDGTAYTDY